DLARRRVALVVVVDAVGRVGEPDGTVRLDHDVVRRVEAPALPMARQGRDAAVVLYARHPPVAVLAGDEPSLRIDRVAVVAAARLHEHRHDAAGLVVPHQAVVRNVRPEEVATRGEVGRPFGPAATGVKALHLRVGNDQLAEAGIEDGNLVHGGRWQRTREEGGAKRANRTRLQAWQASRHTRVGTGLAKPART